MCAYRHRDRSSSDSDSDFTFSSGDSDDGVTVVTVNGKRLTPDEATTRLGNIQIGSGRCLVVGEVPHRKHKHHHKDEVPQRKHKHHHKHHRRKREKSKERRHNFIDPSAVASKTDFDIVASEIGKHWKKLASELGLSRGVIEAVSIDYHAEGTYEQAYQALRKWGQKHANNARLVELVNALENIGCEEICFKLGRDKG